MRRFEHAAQILRVLAMFGRSFAHRGSRPDENSRRIDLIDNPTVSNRLDCARCGASAARSMSIGLEKSNQAGEADDEALPAR